jgi:hypothetical protein
LSPLQTNLLFHHLERCAYGSANRNVLGAAKVSGEDPDYLAPSIKYRPSAVTVISTQVQLNKIMSYAAYDAG